MENDDCHLSVIKIAFAWYNGFAKVENQVCLIVKGWLPTGKSFHRLCSKLCYFADIQEES